MSFRTIRILAIGAVLFTALSLAGPASALSPRINDTDDEFIAVLDVQDYIYGSDRESIALARDICSRIKNAKTPRAKFRTSKTIATAMRVGGWSSGKASAFINSAAVVYCPKDQYSFLDGFAAAYSY